MACRAGRCTPEGFPIIAELDKAKLPILSSSIVAREPYIQKNPQIVENVMRAIIEGAAFCLSPIQKQIR
jgi:ABC-type nitrate/sulfonate/bicarbonate transport system substrate-binding protein